MMSQLGMFGEERCGSKTHLWWSEGVIEIIMRLASDANRLSRASILQGNNAFSKCF